MKTLISKNPAAQTDWHLIDAENKILGKVATDAAKKLMGKHKILFSRNQIFGDHVVVINASRVAVTGKKERQKTYYRYSGYPGGLSTTPLFKMRQEHPERIIEHAVSGMLPKNKLKQGMLKKLHVYPGAEHPFKDKFKS